MSLRVVRDHVVRAIYRQMFVTAFLYLVVTYAQCDRECMDYLIAKKTQILSPITGVCGKRAALADEYAYQGPLEASFALISRYLWFDYVECSCLWIATLITRLVEWSYYQFIHWLMILALEVHRSQLQVYCWVSAFVWLMSIADCADCVEAACIVVAAVEDPPVVAATTADEPTCPRSRSPSVCTSISLARSSEETR
jgi:hypothetical protein